MFEKSISDDPVLFNEHPCIMLPNEISAHPHSCPVDDFQEGNDAEPKKEAKKSPKGGDKLNRSHGNASLQLYHKKSSCVYTFRKLVLPITVSCPKKMLRVAIS